MATPEMLAKAATMARLPRDVVPRHYALHLTPDLDQCTFHGTVEIDVEVVHPVQTVYLNAVDLRVTSASLARAGVAATTPPVAIYHEVASKPILALDFAGPLERGPATLHLAFSGILNDKLAGFYRSKYTVNGEVRYLATTQFEATDARRAFPCWDEPALKATFDVTLVVPHDRVAISNMPIVESADLPETHQRVVRFGRSPVMSTYLLAFIVGEFDSLSAQTETDVEVRVYTPVGKADLGNFALRVATRALVYYSELFGIPYPLPKMDLIAIPDFAAGAMENWGCITYREFALLIDEQQSSQDRRMRVARTVCHEIAHQWFGNLVTMEWWTHLWLNEGFARFLEFFAVNDIFPQWHIWTTFAAAIFDVALRSDAMSSSHAIEVPVTWPEEINEIFDTISYAKGASVIRMLSEYLGPPTLFEGLRTYLKRHQYANATTEDLWQAFEEASGKPVAGLMRMWTRQVGYPVLTIPDGDEAPVTQSRFLTTGEAGPGHWMLPVVAFVDAKLTWVDFGLLDTAADHEKLATWLRSTNSGLVKLNAGQVGFFRVNYNAVLWAGIMSHLPLLPLVDRLGILTDVLEVLEASAHERSLTVWSEMSALLEGYLHLFGDCEWFPLLRRFVVSMFLPHHRWIQSVADRATSSLDMVSMSQFQAITSTILVHVGEPSVLAAAHDAFMNHVRAVLQPRDSTDAAEPARPSTQVGPDQRYPVYSAALAVGGGAVFDTLIELYRRTDLSEEKRTILRVLGTATDPSLLWRAMQFALSPEVRPQDATATLGSVAINPHGRQLVWTFFVEQFDYIMNVVNTGGQSFLVSGFIDDAASSGTTRAQLENVRSFFEEHPVPTATRAISGALEKIRIHISRIEREGPQLSEWLAQWAVRHPASPPTDELPGALEATPAVTEPLTDLALTETASSSSNLAGSASVAD